MKKALITFVRNPELGKVKTRLAKEVGDKKALLVYKKLLEHTKQVISQVICDRYIFTTEPLTVPWQGCFEEKQAEGDLGERMCKAFEWLFNKGYRQLVIIGSDCIELNADHIEVGFSQLEKQDIVIGPAFDGGYYLLGMNQLYPFVFEGITWSSDQVFNQTIQKIRTQNLRMHTLEILSDVDELKDLPLSWR